MPVKIFCIPRQDIGDFWQRAYPWIDSAYAKQDIPVPVALFEDLKVGNKQLWVAWGDEAKLLCAVLTRLAKMRSGLHCEVVAAGGAQVRRWIHGLATIEEWAKSEGCSKVTIQGRPGWAKLLPEYQRSQVILERRLL
jgi:hypothetical protein